MLPTIKTIQWGRLIKLGNETVFGSFKVVEVKRWVVPFFIALIVSACGGGGSASSPADNLPIGGSAPTGVISTAPAPANPATTDTTPAEPVAAAANTIAPIDTGVAATQPIATPDSALPSTDADVAGEETTSAAIENPVESDLDNDGVTDALDAFPLDPLEHTDTDLDGVGNNADPDDDNDGFNDQYDTFPLDSSEFFDQDADGIGDVADPDDDNDGVHDLQDFLPLNPECSSELEIYEGECIYSYSVAAELMESDDNGFVYLINKEERLIFKYDLELQKWSDAAQLNPHTDSDPEVWNIEYSKNHKRLYVNYESGVMTYVDPQTLDSFPFSQSATSISSTAEAGNFIIVREGRANVVMNSAGVRLNSFGDSYSEIPKLNTNVLWLPSVNKLAYIDSQSGIRTYQINQVSGNVDEIGHVEYTQNNEIGLPLIASDNDQQFFTGDGTVFSVSDLSPQTPFEKEFVDAQVSIQNGIIALREEGDQGRLIRYDDNYNVVESITVDGAPQSLVRHGEKYYAVGTDEQGYHFSLFVPSDDTDKDLVVNASDAFPNDPAASTDADGDGSPDAWNAGYTEADSTTGLTLDAYPADWACYLAEDGNGIHCNYDTLLPTTAPSYVTDASNGVIHLFYPTEGILARWDSKTKAYIKPFRVERSANDESYSANEAVYSLVTDRLYLGYPDGAVTYLQLLGNGEQQIEFATLPGSVAVLADAGNYLKIQNYDEGGWRVSGQYYDHAGNAIFQPVEVHDPIAQYLWDEINNRFYYYESSDFTVQYEQLIDQGIVVDTVSSGLFYDNGFIESPGGQILLSADRSTLILGNNNKFDATSLEHEGYFYPSISVGKWTSDNILMIGTSTYNGGKVEFVDENFDRLEQEILSAKPIALLEIDAQLFAVTHSFGAQASIVKLMDSTEPAETTDSETNNSENTDSEFTDSDTAEPVITVPENTDTETSDSENALDTPELASEMVLDNFPAEMVYGVEYQFDLHFINADNPNTTTELIAGPEGLSYDNGMVTWQPTPVMFSPREEFKATFSASDGTTETITINVVNESQSSPIAKSRLVAPGAKGKMKVRDWDGDGTNELLAVDSSNRFSIIEVLNNTVSQKWLYPFSTSDNEDILFIEQLDHEKSSLITVTRDNVELIESPDSPPFVVYTTERQIYGAVYNDVDSDGISDLVLQLSGGEIIVLDTQTFTVTNTFSVSGTSGGLAVGNLDNDPSLEIVAGGEVLDGVTGEVQWQNSSLYGMIEIGDVNNDGINEILRSNYWTGLSSYDLGTKTEIKFALSNVCNIEIINTDSDPQNELIITECQSDGVLIYDLSTGNAVLEQTFEYSDDQYAEALITGDIDNDGFKEIIWQGTPFEWEPTDNPNYSPLVVAAIPGLQDTTPARPIIKSGTPPHKMYSVAHRLEGSGEPRQANFVIPGERHDEGQRLATLSGQGELVVSDLFNEESYDAGFKSFVWGTGVDLTIALPGTQAIGYVDNLQVRRLQDQTLILEHTDLGEVPEFYARRLSAFRGDTLSDGTVVALIGTDKGKIQVYDLTDNQVLWDGPTLASSVDNIGLINDEQGQTVFVHTPEALYRYRPVNGTLFVAGSAEVECEYTELVEIDAEVFIACVYYPESDFYASVSTIKILDSNFTEVNEYSVPFFISAVSKKQDVSGDKLLVGGYHLTNNLHIVEPLSGSFVWTSPSLLGQINGIEYQHQDDNGAGYMSISTSNAIYLTQ